MASTIAGAVAGGAALAAYLDARFHIRNDYRLSNGRTQMERSMKIVAEKIKNGKMLHYNTLEDRAGTPMGDSIFLVFEGREWTYSEFYKALQPVGNWLMKDLGVKKGEMVALDGGNSLEYLLIMFALEAIGASVALINYNLTAQALVHCVKLAGTRYLFADSDVRQLVSPVEEELGASDTKTVYYNPESVSALTDAEPLPAERRTGISAADVACLIYTSGTTGFPKGTVMTRARFLFTGQPSNKIGLVPGHRMYTCLPLYHASALFLCCLPCLGSGATMVLSRKFSNKTFWPEIHSSGATHLQYVGELCRYLLRSPPSPLDNSHRVTTAFGNGLRPDVWEDFRQRFGIENIHEFYSATDGMSFLDNRNRGDFSRGAIAVHGMLWRWRNSADEARVRVDTDTQDIVRDGSGFAIRCGADEPGEMIHRVDGGNKSAPMSTPVYYGNRAAVEKRLATDVFAKGDVWFRSGDMMRLDSDGRLYFVDRLGDTFRWRSENVATAEVGDVMGVFPQVAAANVYGVAVPNADGRAGCAAILAAEGVSVKAEDVASGRGLDLKGLAEHCLENLPRYAVPVFLRVVEQLELTGTMKFQKGRLRCEGIDLDAIEKAATEKSEPVDAMYWLPPGENEYVPFRGKDYQEIKSGRVRL
ncbi:long-chain fatty acid transporter fat1 [Parahypoxylon ruwenzoriense]